MIYQFILNIYLFALIIVGLFSLEAIFLTYKYWRGRKKNCLTLNTDFFPKVTVQLPIYNELYVAERLIQAVCSLDYPPEKLQIQVLDDSDDATTDICTKEVLKFKKRGYNISLKRRKERLGFKAGALKEGLKSAEGELVAIFDADFLPPSDFLKRTVSLFVDSTVGMVQTRWDHLNENFSMLTRTQAFGLAGHFVVEQNGRNSAGYFINFNGTAGIWRKSCIEDSGNWQDDTLTEDLDLSYSAQMKGWKFIFLNSVVTPAELPAEINALKSQQYRWTKGAVETARKILPKLWKSNLPLKIKLHSTLHLTNNFVYPFILVLALLNLPIILIKKHVPESEIFFIIFAFFLLSFGASFLFYALSQKSLYKDWKKRMLLFPVFMSGSMGFSINNTRAVIQGLFKLRTPFIRTPKYELIGTRGSFSRKKYGISIDKMVVVEILMSLYSCLGVVIAVYYFEIGIIPFMLMFFAGFSLIGYLSIKHHLNLKYGRT
jgi:cellulose synthase/poly-beta-1,6-N-acetylglucosamine synthase-like glycosyltransferase